MTWRLEMFFKNVSQTVINWYFSKMFILIYSLLKKDKVEIKCWIDNSDSLLLCDLKFVTKSGSDLTVL